MFLHHLQRLRYRDQDALKRMVWDLGRHESRKKMCAGKYNEQLAGIRPFIYLYILTYRYI